MEEKKQTQEELSEKTPVFANFVATLPSPEDLANLSDPLASSFLEKWNLGITKESETVQLLLDKKQAHELAMQTQKQEHELRKEELRWKRLREFTLIGFLMVIVMIAIFTENPVSLFIIKLLTRFIL